MACRQCLLGALLVLLLSLQSCHANKRVLVLLQDLGAKDTYSKFFDSLTSSGFVLDYKGHRDGSLKLQEYGTWLYDSLVILAPKAEGFGGIDAQAILDFVDSGHNLMLAASSDVSETVRGLAAECGVDIDDKGTKVFDHFNEATADHTTFASTHVVNSPAITGSSFNAPVLFRGVALYVPSDSELAIVALSAPPTAYSHDPRKTILEPPSLMVGQGLALVTLTQARNNARVMVAGSVDMFSNAFYEAQIIQNGQYSATGNHEFCLNLARWTFQDRGVIKTENLRHHLLGSDEQPSTYRVMDDVEFLIDIFEYEGSVKKPYQGDDVDLEFVMLDPYIRTSLKHDGHGTFSLQFKVPDVYGVFKYRINYKHLGYSYINLSHQVPVRPFKHNEYERFLVCAYPYYASALSSMLAFFLLGWFFLYHK